MPGTGPGMTSNPIPYRVSSTTRPIALRSISSRIAGANSASGRRCEMLGLILPSATRIKPILTPYAAIGLATIVVLATGFHAVRGEYSALPVSCSSTIRPVSAHRRCVRGLVDWCVSTATSP